VRVAWVTHHLPRANHQRVAVSGLPGDLVGGAEMADAAMIAKAPPGVVVDLIAPEDWLRATDGYDRIVITGTDLLAPVAMQTLATFHPIVWVHHLQTPSAARAELFAAAAPFITMSELHRDLEAKWSGVRGEICNGWLDPDEVTPAVKVAGSALWAARDDPSKGRIDARLYANRHGYDLREISGTDRPTVLAAMATAEHFIFLPKLIDACPRTLIEAELAGCEIHTNAHAGRREPGNIRDVLNDQAGRFWAWVA
jgi:hypothetical protein